MNNIEKDIKILEDWLKVLDDFFEKTRINNTKERNALRNALAERKQDKKKIKELEEQNEILKNFTSAIFNDNIEKEFITVHKVKEKIEEAKYNKKVGNTAYEYTEEDVWDIVKDELEKLLEESK